MALFLFACSWTVCSKKKKAKINKELKNSFLLKRWVSSRVGVMKRSKMSFALNFNQTFAASFNITPSLVYRLPDLNVAIPSGSSHSWRFFAEIKNPSAWRNLVIQSNYMDSNCSERGCLRVTEAANGLHAVLQKPAAISLKTYDTSVFLPPWQPEDGLLFASVFFFLFWMLSLAFTPMWEIFTLIFYCYI